MNNRKKRIVFLLAVWIVAMAGIPAGSGTFGGSQSPLEVRGWIQDKTGWRYRQANYQLAVNTWIFVDNNWFYLNPVSDGTRGAMRTGWQTIEGQTYFLNPVSDGTRGAMKTGYQQVDGNWYYFDPGQGFLWKNQRVPDGRWADGNGILS